MVLKTETSKQIIDSEPLLTILIIGLAIIFVLGVFAAFFIFALKVYEVFHPTATIIVDYSTAPTAIRLDYLSNRKLVDYINSKEAQSDPLLLKAAIREAVRRKLLCEI